MQTLQVDQLVGQIIGGYHIERLLGQTRLSAVYLAQNTQGPVALNTFIIPEQFSREAHNRFMVRFTKEAVALTLLNHRNLLPVYAYGEQYGYPYLVTPYTMHGSLADILKQEGRCEPTYVLSVLEQIAAGLEYAHRKGILHGSLRPSNILLSSEQRMLVAGLGLTQMLQLNGIEQSDQPHAHLLSIAGTLLGSPEYLAPEVVQGQPGDTRSDIYALGIILFELLHGKPPFTGDSPLDVAQQHMQPLLPSLHALHADIPIALELVINHALTRNPNQRFQRVSELVEAFAQVYRGMINGIPTPGGEHRKQVLANNVQLRSTVYINDMQDSAKQSAIADTWQLMPPVVTGKIDALQQLRHNTDSLPVHTMPSGNATGSWQFLPPIVTGKVPAIDASPKLVKQVAEPSVRAMPQAVAAPAYAYMAPDYDVLHNKSAAAPFNTSVASAGTLAGQPPQPVQPALPIVPVQSPASAKRALPMDVTPTDWWTRVSTEFDDAEEPASRQPQPVSATQSQQEPIRLGQTTLPQQDMAVRQPEKPQKSRWEQEAELVKLPPSRGQRSRSSYSRRPQTIGRRKVVAMLAVGSVAAVGIAFAGVSKIHLTMNQAANPGNTTTTPAKNTQAKKGTGTPKQNAPAQTKPAANVVGSKTLAANSAADFKNPADGNASLLIHLPNNNFVAYEKACTHQGVAVYYDPGTQKLVCPAHGSIFDPANGGAVVQGPATRPIATVKIQVNTDGTITTL